MTTVVRVTDNFNRANETPLSGGGVWTDGAGGASVMNLASNVVVPPTDNDRQAIYEGRTWDKDQSSKAKLTTTGTAGGGAGAALWVRCTNAAGIGGYRMTADHAATNNWKVNRVIAAAFTPIATFTQAWVDGDTVELTVVGSAGSCVVRVYLNNVLIQTVTDSSTMTLPGAPGIGHSSSSAGTVIDDWEGGEVPGDPVQVPRVFPAQKFGPF